MRKIYSKSREEMFEVMVDWNLGNECNLRCSYCAPGFYNGNNAFPDLASAKLIVDKIHEKHHMSNRAIRFSFIGGEPTLWDSLPDLLQHIRDKGFISEIKSNGTRPVAVWRLFMPNLSSAIITHHRHSTNYDDLVGLVSFLRDEFVQVAVNFAIEPDHDAFEDQFARYERFKDAFPHVGASLELLYADYPIRRSLMRYTPEQMERFQRTLPTGDWLDHVIEDENGTRTTHLGEIYSRGLNSFLGMHCRIGADQIVIDQDGTIRRGWCRVGGVIGTVQAGDFEKPTDGIVCTKKLCSNPLDLSVSKHSVD